MNKQKIIQSLDWIIVRLPERRRSFYKEVAAEWVGTIERWLHRGNVDGIGLVKATRLHYTRYLAGTPLHNSAHFALGLNRKGLPRKSGRLQILADGDMYDKRFLMTLLTLSRTLPGWKANDFTPITDPGKPVDPQLEDQIASLAPKISITTDFEELHVTTKMGPMGLALDMSLNDLALLPESGIAKCITELGGQTLKDVMNEAFALLETYGPLNLTKPKCSTLRRLSVKKDLESKARVFAILDYWSQTALKRLHEELLKVLKGFKADCTFDQGSRLGRIIPRDHFHSIDLSNATDRFPISLQEKVLSKFVGPDKAMAWKRIMVELPFSHGDDSYQYMRGQPMGAYSSWPLFAITHHLVVQYAAERVGKTNYSNYMLLGDDIVVGDDDVADMYREILRELDVPTSETKTHVSKDTYEFAKRWIHREQEITGLPLQGLFNYSGPSSALSFLQTIESIWSLDSQVSRSDLKSLIRPVTRHLSHQNRMFQVERIYETLMIPTGPMRTWTTGDNYHRVWKTYNTLCRAYLGCHARIERVLLALGQFIPMAKIKSCELAIKATVKGLNSYRNELIKAVAVTQTAGMPPDLPHELLAHPALRAGLAYARSAQLKLDTMEELIATGREEEILEDPIVIGFDPSKLLAVGQKELKFLFASKVPKEIKHLMRQSSDLRFRLFNENDYDPRKDPNLSIGYAETPDHLRIRN